MAKESFIPRLPFPGFKWKWASLQPTESLNRPDIFLGVLRAMARNEGKSKSDAGFINDLQKVEVDLDLQGKVNLARTSDRNIIRNSGQYWKVLGVLGSERKIRLTDLGRAYAQGAMTVQEFGIQTLFAHELPSTVYTSREIEAWKSRGIRFKPLMKILEIVISLGNHEATEGFITEFELAYVVQPLSASLLDPRKIAEVIMDYRRGLIDIDNWPKTVDPTGNDYRVSNEFLLWLVNYGFLRRSEIGPFDVKYFLGDLSAVDYLAIKYALMHPGPNIQKCFSALGEEMSRKRVTREILERPDQKKFRDSVLIASSGQCLISGTRLNSVLQAAHIHPVANNGSDVVGNGLCLRSDLHILFDAGRIKIDNKGSLSYAPEVLADPVYADLPRRIDLPSYIDGLEIEWRWNYS